MDSREAWPVKSRFGCAGLDESSVQQTRQSAEGSSAALPVCYLCRYSRCPLPSVPYLCCSSLNEGARGVPSTSPAALPWGRDCGTASVTALSTLSISQGILSEIFFSKDIVGKNLNIDLLIDATATTTLLFFFFLCCFPAVLTRCIPGPLWISLYESKCGFGCSLDTDVGKITW